MALQCFSQLVCTMSVINSGPSKTIKSTPGKCQLKVYYECISLMRQILDTGQGWFALKGSPAASFTPRFLTLFLSPRSAAFLRNAEMALKAIHKSKFLGEGDRSSVKCKEAIF